MCSNRSWDSFTFWRTSLSLSSTSESKLPLQCPHIAWGKALQWWCQQIGPQSFSCLQYDSSLTWSSFLEEGASTLVHLWQEILIKKLMEQIQNSTMCSMQFSRLYSCGNTSIIKVSKNKGYTGDTTLGISHEFWTDIIVAQKIWLISRVDISVWSPSITSYEILHIEDAIWRRTKSWSMLEANLCRIDWVKAWRELSSFWISPDSLEACCKLA